jgi:hypothetical protein
MERVVRCPKCGGSFEPSVVMREQIEAEVRSAMKAELEERLSAAEALATAKLRANEEELTKARTKVADREAALLKEHRELSEQKERLELDVERRVTEEARRVCDRQSKVLHEKYAREAEERLRQKDQELAEARAKAAAAAAIEAELLRKQRELEDREQRVALDLERRLATETRRIREEEGKLAEQRASIEREQQKLREEEHRQTIDSLRNNISELQRRIQQGSQQMQGEAQEVVLRDLLAGAFAMDVVEDVAKGVSGADVLQHVRAEDGSECGTIAWESKRTKAWSEGWLPKLRDDQRSAGAVLAILVSQELPKDVHHFGLKDGAWVCSWPYAVALGTALRAGILDVAHAKRAAEGRGEKMLMLYEYLTGTEFRNRVGGFVEALVEMQVDLEREKRAMSTLWKRRERQMQRARDNITAFYGDLQGIAGHKLTDLPALALKPAQPSSDVALEANDESSEPEPDSFRLEPPPKRRRSAA